MEGIGFILFLVVFWGAYEIGRKTGYKNGVREGTEKGYEIGFTEGVRITTMAINNPEKLEYEMRIKNIVDSEFVNHSY